MTHPGEQQAEIVELTEGQFERLRQVLGGVAVAHKGLAQAEDQLTDLEAAAERIDVMRGRAKSNLRGSADQLLKAEAYASSNLHELLSADQVDTEGILDAWYEYRSSLRFNLASDEEYGQKIEQDGKDRDAFDRLIPGAKIIKLNAHAVTAGEVVAPAKLELKGLSDLELKTVFQTKSSTGGKEVTDLDGLASNFLIGKDAIKEFFASYEPYVLPEPVPSEYGTGGRNVSRAERDIELADALTDLGLDYENDEAFAKFKQAIAQNCARVLGLSEPEENHRIYSYPIAIKFLNGVKQVDSQAFDEIYDKIALATYQTPGKQTDHYAVLMAGIVLEKPHKELSIAETGGTLTELKERGKGLAEPGAN